MINFAEFYMIYLPPKQISTSVHPEVGRTVMLTLTVRTSAADTPVTANRASRKRKLEILSLDSVFVST